MILNKDMERIASRLNIPLCKQVNVTVPYLTSSQRTSIQNIIKNMIRSTHLSSWERQAIRARIRVVASAPLNVRRAFERLTNKHDKSTVRPPCHCDRAHLLAWEMAGPVSQVEGHYAILPVTITHNNQPLRATDPRALLGNTLTRPRHYQPTATCTHT